MSKEEDEFEKQTAGKLDLLADGKEAYLLDVSLYFRCPLLLPLSYSHVPALYFSPFRPIPPLIGIRLDK